MFKFPFGPSSISRQNINIYRYSLSKMVYLYSDLMQRVRLIIVFPLLSPSIPPKITNDALQTSLDFSS